MCFNFRVPFFIVLWATLASCGKEPTSDGNGKVKGDGNSQVAMSYVGNFPRKSDGSFDVARLSVAARDLNATSFQFVIPTRDSLYADDFSRLPQLLEDLFNEDPQMKMEVLLTGFNLPARRPYYKQYADWMKAISDISNRYFQLSSVVLDDFFVANSDGSFTNPDTLRSVCQAKAPQIKLYATLYCGSDAGGSFIANYSSEKKQTRVLVDYLRAYPELRECVSGVNLYTHPDILTSAQVIQNCVSDLSQLSGLEIRQGVYISNLAERSMDFTQRKRNVDLARRVRTESYSFYLTPLKDSSGLATNPTADSSSLITQTYNYVSEVMADKGGFVLDNIYE